MPVDQDQLETLNAHERNKTIAQNLHYHAIPSKDTVTAKQLITRIEQAAAVCNWNDQQKALQLQCALKGNAAIWLEAQEKSFFMDIKDYPELKKHFLEVYDTAVTSSSLSCSLKELSQRPGERVVDYSARSLAVFNKYYDAQMERCCDVSKPKVSALVTDATRPVALEQRKYAANMMLVTMQMSLYEAGLSDPLRLEVSQNSYENLREMQKAAQAAEARRAAKKPIPVVAALEEEDGDLDLNVIELEAEEYDQLNAVYASKGRRMPTHYRRRNGFRKPNHTAKARTLTAEQKKLLTCWHCNKKGHVIEDCKARKAGKPKHQSAGPQNNRPKIHEVEADEDITQKMNSVTVSSIRIPSLQQPHLNY